MPNWVNNRLSVTGPADVVAQFKEAAVGFGQRFAPTAWDLDRQAKALSAGKPDPLSPRESPFCFHALVPLPGNIAEMNYSDHGYDLERATWGIKWGDCKARIVGIHPGRLVYEFDTAWSAPESFLDKLSRAPRWRELTFVLSWGEEDQTRGRFVVRRGAVYFDLYEREDNRVGHDECDESGPGGACSACAKRDSWRHELIATHDDFVQALSAAT